MDLSLCLVGTLVSNKDLQKYRKAFTDVADLFQRFIFSFHLFIQFIYLLTLFSFGVNPSSYLHKETLLIEVKLY